MLNKNCVASLYDDIFLLLDVSEQNHKMIDPMHMESSCSQQAIQQHVSRGPYLGPKSCI